MQAFQALAKEPSIYIALPFFENSKAGMYYNTVALLDSQGHVTGLYRKNHIPFTKSYEKYYFTPGNGFSAALPHPTAAMLCSSPGVPALKRPACWIRC